MDVVLNDYAIAAQFVDIEDFVDSLVEDTFPVFERLERTSTILFKSQETYSRRITPAETIYEFLCSQRFAGFPEAQKLRSLLSKMVDEPFWENDVKTESNSLYYCEYTDEFYGDSPNCFSEALERDGILISFQHPDFRLGEIEIRKDGQENKLFNLFNGENTAEVLFLKNKIGFSEFLFSSLKKYVVEFYSKNQKYFADDYYEKGKLTLKDTRKIKEELCLFLEGRKSGEVLSRLSDSITHKGLTYGEFRTTISDKREFRLFYYENGTYLVFFDALIKTTKTTPDHVKDRTYLLIKQYLSEKK